MHKHAEDHQFLVDQFNEIKRYIEKHPDDNPDKIILHWIKNYASEYRMFWNNKQEIKEK